MTDLTTDMATLATADWDALEREVVSRIRLLKATAQNLDDPMADKIAQDLILPNVMLLAKFCSCVSPEEPDDEEDMP